MKINSKFRYLILSAVLLFSSSAAFAAQSELKTVAVKLLHVMFGVVIATIVIYIGLLIYSKIRLYARYGQKFEKTSNKNTLVSSENLEDAIEHFIKDSQ